MMSENLSLTISIGADSTKLRADLEIAKAQVNKFGSELRAAAKQSLTTGDTAAVAGIAGHYEAAAKHASLLKAEIAAANVQQLTFNQRLREGVEHFEGIKGRFGG